MSRIYQLPKQHQPTTVSPAVSNNNLSSNNNNNNNRVGSNVKLFTNNPASTVSTSAQSTNDKIVGKSPNTQEIDNNNKMSQDNLACLINRLESVTNRLESLASQPNHKQSLTNGASSGQHQQDQADDTEQLASIIAFDSILNNCLNTLVQQSSKIGSDVKTMLDLVFNLFKLQKNFLIEAARSKQPSQDVLQKFYQQFSKNIEQVNSFREEKRKSDYFNHLSAISESISALGWIAVQPTPVPYIKDMIDSAQFYTNRVLKDYKEKDANHVNWAKQWIEVLNELQSYVKQYHTTGVVWNSSKKSHTFNTERIFGVSGNTSSNGTAAPGGPLPPPPPLPDFDKLLADDSSSKQSASTAALFAELNKGSTITSHLKKVNDDQKTHKNPNLRSTSVVPAKQQQQQPAQPANKLNTKGPAVNKPPVFELEDEKKWKVEYQIEKNDLVIDKTDIKQTVYIYQCYNSTIVIKGKVNSILLDSCHRVGVLFDDVLSTVEFINCKNVQMQVIGKVPTIAIEKTDGCQMYLSKNSLATDIVTSKSSAMNVLIPNETDDDCTEHPIPEQFKTCFDSKTKKLVTLPTESV